MGTLSYMFHLKVKTQFFIEMEGADLPKDAVSQV